ncbi:retrovirus-related pol polyprotein from transposon TNT 1-94 [Tanacetum coccineum]
MYKVKILKQQETSTNKAKSILPSSGLKAASSFRRPSNRESPFKNSVLSNTNNSSEKVEVSVRTNKKTYVASKNVVSNKKIVTDVDVKNALKANDVLCVSCAKNVVQIVLWIVDSGCSKHMTGDHSLLKNFVEKFIGMVRFKNDHFAAITGSAYEANLYTISISYMAASSPVCLLSKITSTKSWLWRRRLSHLNFGTINDLTKHDLVDGLPKFKYSKDRLCSACERGKSKKSSHQPKLVPSTHSKLELLHMDLCGPMRVVTINGKKYILVIVDDYSRFTWVYFLHTKDETLKIIKKFIAQVQLNYNAKVYKIRTDNGTEFKNATLKARYEKLSIMQQFLIAQTLQQNGVFESRNRTLVEAARTMLIVSRLPEFL